MSNVAIITQSVVTPSYLKHFDLDFEKIKIIFAKKPSTSSLDGETMPKSELSCDNSLDENDLTGDPLKVDLGENDSLSFVKTEETNNWSTTESKYFPISVREARRELNKLFRIPNAVEDLPVFVICNGDDCQHTVVLSRNKSDLMAVNIVILDIIEVDNVIGKLSEMTENHLKTCGNKSTSINFLVKMKYNIYGKSLKNLSYNNVTLRNMDHHANVNIDVSCNKCVFVALEGTNANVKMNLEIIAGHRLLSLSFLWEEMYFLHTYIDVLMDKDSIAKEETVLCKTPVNEDEILRTIVKLVSTKFLDQSANKDVDLKNIRNQNFLDELWNILKCCENISILKSSFHFLFEELGETNNRSLILKDETSNIGTIINGVLNGKLILSAINNQQAVELLFELGAQKVKNDFQVILNQFSSTIKTNIDLIWRTFWESAESSSQNRARSTRVTHNIKHSQINSKIRQLSYLSQLYIGAEFIYLIKEHIFLHEKSFYYFCECIEKEYVLNSKKFNDFEEILESPLCEMSFSLDSKNFSIEESLYPSHWTLHMDSKINSVCVRTTYHLSGSPIFPPAIHDYDIPKGDEMIYYMAKMTITKGLI